MKQGVQSARVHLVADADYAPVVSRVVDECTQRCTCSLFIVDLADGSDRELVVDTLLLRLQAAQWRGVQVQLLLGGSRDNFDIAEVALAARIRAERLGLPARLMASRDVRGSHVKLVVADDWTLLGSHNWSFGAFTNQTQDSLLFESPALAARMADYFDRQWGRANADV